MKNVLLAMAIYLLLAATGCQTLMQNDSPIARDSYEILNSKNRSDFNVINPDKDYHGIQQFGFVRHQRATALPRGGTNPQIAVYDPELLADAISKLAVLIPNVHDVATLVTDRHVLIAYETTSENRFETADQVKRTALSCVPRFFHVYVSDKPEMIHSIERFGSLSSRAKNIDEVLEETIEEMLQSPQGRRISASENENGEYDNNMNGYMDAHNHHEKMRRTN
jgi:hypothetical protein